jgi:hypothetical protein
MRCGVWIDPAAAAAGRLVPIRLEVVALSVGGLMPGGRARDIGCLHAAPVSSAPDAELRRGAVAALPDDGRRVCCEVQLTSQAGGALGQAARRRAQSVAATVGEGRVAVRKRKESEPIDAPDAERQVELPEERAVVKRRRKSVEAATVDLTSEPITLYENKV